MNRQTVNDVEFELLHLSAARVAGGVAVVEIEGRFTGGGRFARRPRLVLETREARIQHQPVHSETVAGTWRGAYAVPADDLDAAGLALGVRGALLELPDPDVEDDRDRFAALAREANRLRRRLAAAEEQAAAADARERETRDATRAELAAALDEAEAMVERVRAEAAEEVERVRAGAAAELDRVRDEASAELEARSAEADGRAQEAERRAGEAHERAAALEVDAATARDALADERRRAEGSVRELQAALDAARAEARDAPAPSAPPSPVPAPHSEERADDDTRAQPPRDDTTTVLPLVHAGARAAEPPRADSPEAHVRLHGEPSPARWVAVGALLVFILVLLVLLGFV